VVRIAGTALLTTAGVLATEAGVTALWQEPVTYLYASVKYGAAEDELRALRAEYVGSSEIEGRRALRNRAQDFGAKLQPGDAMAKVQIPRLGLSEDVFQAIGPSSLERGLGHYEGTSYPGAGGRVGFAGHRTTYGAPFRDLDQLNAGDRLIVVMPYGRFVYVVTGTQIVLPGDASVLGEGPREGLVLTTCHPEFSDAERLVVFSRLVSGLRPLDAASMVEAPLLSFRTLPGVLERPLRGPIPIPRSAKATRYA
jgi:sortase A